MTSLLSPAARALLSSARSAHMVTTGLDDAPHVTLVWVALDGDDLLVSHMAHKRKLDHIARQPRVALSVQGDRDANGIDEYLVVYGVATVTSGLHRSLIDQLRHTYLGEELADSPSNEVDTKGFTTRIVVQSIRGNGPWVR